jgi:hypothetical protein
MSHEADHREAVLTCLRQMLALPLWNARNQFGTWLVAELGDPKLIVGDVRRERSGAMRRPVSIQGTCCLWIEWGSWTLHVGTLHVTEASGTDEKARACSLLEGQMIEAIHLTSATKMAVVRFDLGATVHVVAPENAGDIEGEKLCEFWSQDALVWMRPDGAVAYGNHDDPGGTWRGLVHGDLRVDKDESDA